MTQVIQRNNHVLQMLKRLKETLDNDKKKYADKVNVLVMTWERIAASAREQRPLAAICIVEKMYKDTLSIMLQGEWPKMSPVSKTHLIQMLNRCRTDLCKEIPWLHYKFKKLLELVNDPWTLPSLERILHKEPSPATPEQIIEFCESERGLLIITRLTMLCSSRCEKVAIKLAEACFRALNSDSKLLSLFSTNEYNFIFEIYLCLLYKYKKLESIIKLLKTVSVTEGYFLVCRLRNRRNLHVQKIWKFSHQVAAIAARYFITVSMLSRSVSDSRFLKSLISDWLSMCKSSGNNVENEVRKVMQPAETSEHIYIMAEILTSHQSSNKIYSSLIMELYIRALTADINYLERVKLQNDKEQLKAYEKHLASKFLALADLVKDHGGVRREFVLTAFSIHPSPEIYRRVEEEAIASGKASSHSTPNTQESIEVGVLSEGLSSLSSEEPDGKETATDYSVNNDSQDSGAFLEISNRCPLHLPYDGIGPEGELCFQCGDFTGIQAPQSPTNQKTKKERSLDALILIKGNTVTESLNYDALSAPSQVLEAEKLGLSSQVCADLVTLLGSNRYHLLTWVLEWGELSSRCRRYMEEADTIKSGKKELKFLEIDYNQYKDWPGNEEETDCIEKGYEQWLEDDNTETDFDTDSKRSNTDDSEELMIKTAIKRSQKQTGRYAESSSDSESSRSRPRNRKRGRPRKRLKDYSDSGSVSDSLGSDGQKQRRSSKKSSSKPKDLRKKLCTLKVLEMAVNGNNFSSGNDSMLPENRGGKKFSLPTSSVVRSDPTVLKSLRAFRPNAHKLKNDEFIHSLTENCFNTNTFSCKIIPNIKSAAIDCNDNKFITKDGKCTFGSKDMEIHFLTSGVKTKKHNDMITTMKEDFLSASSISSARNKATSNATIVHIEDSLKSRESLQNVEEATQKEYSVSVPFMLTSKNANVTFTPNSKSENESQGSHMWKSTSSLPLGSNADIIFCSSSTLPTGNVSSYNLTSLNPTTKTDGSDANQFVTAVNSRPGENKIIRQSQFKAIVNKNPLNQPSIIANRTQNFFENRHTSDSMVDSVTTCTLKTAGQLLENLITEATKIPIQTERVTVPTMETPKFSFEDDRPNVVYSRNLGVQNVTRTSSSLNNNVTCGLNNGKNLTKKPYEFTAGTAEPNSEALKFKMLLDSSSQNISSSRLALETAPNSKYTQTETNPIIMTILTSNSLETQKTLNESTGQANVSKINSVCVNTSKSNAVHKEIDDDIQILNCSPIKSGTLNYNVHSKNSAPTNLVTNKISQTFRTSNVKIPQTVILQTNVSGGNKDPLSGFPGAKSSFQIGSNSIVKSSNYLEDINVSQNLPETLQEDIVSHSGIVNNSSSYVTPINLDIQNVSSTSSTATTFVSKNSDSYSCISNRPPVKEAVNITQSIPNFGQGSAGVLDNKIFRPLSHSSSENSDIIVISNSPSGAKLNSSNIKPTRNILETVLKRNSARRLSSTLNSPQYSGSNTRNSIETNNHGDAVRNVMVSKSLENSTLHCKLLNSVQQKGQQDSLITVVSDMIERVVKEELQAPRSVMTPLITPLKNSYCNKTTPSVEICAKDTERYGSLQDLNAINQQHNKLESKKTKSGSTSSTVQTESNFIKKQVLNNQKITILVQNSDGDKTENQQKAKLNELLFRDDQKTCITLRAVKRTQSDGNHDELPMKKKEIEHLWEGQNGEVDGEKHINFTENIDSTVKDGVNSSETLCQYLVLEAINDPSGALPKFNQAFGKSYQVKIPQPVRPEEANNIAGNEGTFGVMEQGKTNTRFFSEPNISSMHYENQVPVTVSSRGGSTFEIVQRPVKSVYIDKEVKSNFQYPMKANEGALETSNISTIQMTEVQQTSVNNYQNIPKVARPSVVQQLLKKVPATGPPTVQAVNTVNTLTTKQVKTQDIVSGSTLIYSTETRSQSQIVIQRAVGRVNNTSIGQVRPVIYTQNANDQASTSTQTLLLTAVPRGVVPSAQIVRLPSSSGVWKMTPSANSPRILQLRPQNLLLQSGQDQGIIMQSGQSVLLHHLTSLPVKPLGVVTNNTKTEQSPKIDVKNDIYIRSNVNVNGGKIYPPSLEVNPMPIKNSASTPTIAVSEQETVSLMKDIKEFENVFEETKLKFEMEEQQGVCVSGFEAETSTKTPLTSIHAEVTNHSVHQTVLVHPQLMLQKPQMIITPGTQNQQIFTQKIDKQTTLGKDSEKKLILTTKQNLGIDERSSSQVAVAYVSHGTAPTVSVQKPLVVVANYTQASTSPVPSITSQNSSPNNAISSVSLTGTSTTMSKTPTKTKSRNTRTNSSKSSSVSKIQQKPQEDPNTAQKIYAILEEYAMHLKNSPDMNNRPAPRRRSNNITNANVKRKKTIYKNKESFSDGDDDTNLVEDVTENSEDGSDGLTVLQVCVTSSQ